MSTTIQPGILAMGSRSHYYLELDLTAPPAELAPILGDGLAEPRATTGGVNLVLALGRSVAAQLGDVPPDLADFSTLRGPDGFEMPAAQHDVWAWISASSDDIVFDTARAVAAAFAPVATIASHRAAFTYLDSRDLSGFEDGTENPPISEAPAVLSVPEGTAGAGGSIVLVQRWVHDLASLHALDEEAQERIIGRTKATSDELDDDVRPETAHISRVVIEEDGDELEVFRRSTPYGDIDENGLMFVAFSADQRRLDLMLRRMVGLDGPRDALTTWSTPVAGAYYYAPPLEAFTS
jgi:putative iron-dependent peroxidase